MRRLIRVFGCGLVLMSPVSAAAALCVALVGGTVVLPGGAESTATVVMVDGRVAGVGADVDVPADCERIDVVGRVVTPGLVDVHTHLGLVEVSQEKQSVDHSNARGGEAEALAVTPSFQVADAYNPRSTVVPVTRTGGVTSVVTLPQGGVVSGQSAWVDLAGDTQAEALVRRAVAMHAHLSGSELSRATVLHRLRTLFAESQAYSERRAAWEGARSRDWLFSHVELEAFSPVLRRELPLVIRANRASDIEAALRLATEYSFRLVIAGGAEALLVAPDLARAGVPVIVDPLLFRVRSFDDVYARPDNAARLAEAGVTVLISAFASHNIRTLRQAVGNAIREGLPRALAFRAVSEGPADAFGLADYGRIQVGAVANVVVWSGDPFELSTHAEAVYIGGQRRSLTTRQSRLRDRYLHLPGSPTLLPLP